MLKTLWLLPLAAGIAVASAVAVAEEPAKPQMQAQEQVYGSQLMTQEERAAYRAKMRAAKNPEEREKIRAEHHEQMKARAKEKGVTLPDVPPAGGAMMGPGGGMKPGGSMSPGSRGGY